MTFFLNLIIILIDVINVLILKFIKMIKKYTRTCAAAIRSKQVLKSQERQRRQSTSDLNSGVARRGVWGPRALAALFGRRHCAD